MAENDDTADKVIPFPVGHTMTAALSRQLVDFYKELPSEELPGRHLALLQQFNQLAKAKSEPGEPSENAERPNDSKTG